MSETMPVSNSSQPWYFWLLSVFSGFLMMLSWPNVWVASFAAWPSAVAWVSLIPYIYVWRRVGWRGAMIHAWVMGFIYYFGILSWITLVNRDTNVDNTITWMILTVCGAFYLAAFGATSKMVADRFDWPGALVVPLGWTAWEFLRGHVLFGGWPWGSLGHTQYSNPVVRQLAAVAGVGGISFFVAEANFFLAWIGGHFITWARRGFSGSWDLWQPQVWKARARTHPVLYGFGLSLGLIWMVLLIWVAVESVVFYRAPKHEMRLAMLQGNTDTTQKWNREYKTSLMERMARLQAQAVAEKPELVIWAESCFPGMLGNDDQREWEDQLKQMIRTGGVPTLLTSNEYLYEPGDEERYHHYNSAFLLGADGEILGRYRKIHLVPFGEYIPWDFLKNFLHAVVREPIPVDFEPGHEYASIEYGALKFSPLICYEDGFEELGIKLARHGARFFAGLANDRWAGTSAMSYQHTATSVFLAIEHRVYMAKANMTGPTCLVDPWGSISQPLPYFQEGVKTEKISYVPGFKTLFTRLGNAVPFGMVLVFFGLLAVVWIFPKKTT